jgi:hypothetical protein
MAPDLRVGLAPALLVKLDALMARMAAVGHPMKICQGLRTAEYQHSLYLYGHDGNPGKIRTNCDGYVVKSNHQAAGDGLGHAVDLCFLGNDPFGPTQPWATFGAIAQAEGLRWGGTYKIVDLDHVEMPYLPLPAHAV